MMMMNFDDWFTNKIVGPWVIPLACRFNVHPNVLTAFALVASACLPFLHLRGSYGWVLALAVVRQVLDCLDGAVARGCDRTSRLGGFLDTCADYIFAFSAVFILVHMLRCRCGCSMVAVVVASAMLCALWLTVQFGSYDLSVLYDHDAVKRYDANSRFKTFVAAVVNNTLLIVPAGAVLYYLWARGRAPCP